jgi:thioredoxin 1
MRHEDIGGYIEIDDAERPDDAAEALRLLRVAHGRVERRQAQCTVEGDRAALEEERCPGEVVAPAGKHGCDIECRGLVEHDAEGAGLVMLEYEDYCPMEGLLEVGRRDQEQSGLRRIRWTTDRGGLKHRAIVARDDVVHDTLGGMTTVALTEETFAPTVQGSPIVLIDFWAAWCGPCRQFAPVFEKVSDAHADIVFAKVDTEAEPGLAQVFQISSIPTLMAIRDGVVLYSQAGALPEQGLEQLIQAIRDVDMGDVRASIADEKAGASE